jgi:transcriptional regulator with XRE-family HTH domain
MGLPRLEIEVTPALRAQIGEVDPQVLAAAVQLEIMDRREAARNRRVENKDAKGRANRQPRRGRFKAISSGRYARRSKPQSSVDDRRFVPGALRHWRQIHGLSLSEAQHRIGYSSKSTAWTHWENGYSAPPYRTLLYIIIATGLGHAIDEDPRRREMDPSLLLDYGRQKHLERQREQRRRRAERV